MEGKVPGCPDHLIDGCVLGGKKPRQSNGQNALVVLLSDNVCFQAASFMDIKGRLKEILMVDASLIKTA
ncbi:hypothetical protein LVJ83_03135 [Uruburuella testudinis]|uniref:Uncharacterized protein n=1 Tax=Uruburuella testudinis TaxID=1282863 RepID=A0ABY4E0H6_9NEIS|nr:hypothetical protein [Uruburuella testudinis]UOO82476.1 hypothetical protein LVJ83_03135 [Uruburuella testudinis]